jgi:hypothetical protein
MMVRTIRKMRIRALVPVSDSRPTPWSPAVKVL